MGLVAAGVSFRTAPLEVRERVALSESQARQLLGFLAGHADLSGAAVLSTCNRTELYVDIPDDADPEAASARLCRYLDPADPGEGRHVAVFHDGQAVEHLFSVAAGLESMVVGESQVLGQVRAAHRLALETGSLDATLDLLFRRAIEAGRRVRRETAIGRGAGSLGEAAVAMATDVLGSLEGRTAVLVGAGKMSTLAARRLHRLGAHLRVNSRGGESAAALAGELGATTVTAEDLVAAVTDSDLVISSTTSATPVLSAADLARAQDRRRGRRLCVIDLAVPRDVEPAAGTIPGVVLLDIDEVGRRLESSLRGRREAAADARSIVRSEAERTVATATRRGRTDSTIRALVEHAEQIRRGEVARTVSRLGEADAMTMERIETMSRSLVRKLLHEPIAHLRRHAGDPETAAWLGEAFGLGGDPPPDPER
jgi:glutamyl-tRNA reductase